MPIINGSVVLDALTAEVHMVIRDHVPKVAGLVGETTHTFAPGCDYSVFGGLIESPDYGAEGPNTSE